MRVFTVWQPMLASDMAPPITPVLERMRDGRVQQYWDPDHLLARRMARDARHPQPEPDCCIRSGILWDLAAVYARGATWTDKLPPATLFSGPVDAMAAEIDTLVRGAGTQ